MLVERSMASTISFNAAMDACGKAWETLKWTNLPKAREDEVKLEYEIIIDF